MPISVNALVVDSKDPAGLARFWSQALDWQIVYESDDEILVTPSQEREPGVFPLLFGANSDVKGAKNRWHFDLTPSDQAAEVVRLEGLGATRIDIGQGDVSWVVMADPEGNEFCVLKSLPPD